MQDERVPTPTLQSLAQSGAIAKGMSTINPTVTWPNHTTLVTGDGSNRHFVLFNGRVVHHCPDQPVTVDENPRQEDVVKIETIYDRAFDAGLVTAQVAWPATIKAKKINWSFGETPNPDGEIERDLVAQGKCTRQQLQNFDGSQAWRDEIYTDAAIDILTHHTPDLLLVHLLATDVVQHEYGPHSGAADTAYAFEDDRVKQIVDALKSANLLDRTTLFVVSDHGFRVVNHVINLNALLLQKGWAERAGQSTTARAWTIAHGGVAMAYVSDPSKRALLIPQLKALFSTVEGVDHVYSPEELAEHGLPSRAQTDQSPDLFLTAKAGYFFDEETTGPVVHTVERSGEHGYLNSDPDMNALFIAAGAGIRRGVRLDVFPNTDVAPTIAKVLGISYEGMDGSPLTEILTGK
jgi:predicted AlkP superfamily pyrophosphatase or phosphodiesterase